MKGLLILIMLFCFSSISWAVEPVGERNIALLPAQSEALQNVRNLTIQAVVEYFSDAKTKQETVAIVEEYLQTKSALAEITTKRSAQMAQKVGEIYVRAMSGAGAPTDQEISVFDVSGDGSIDIQDLRLLYSYSDPSYANSEIGIQLSTEDKVRIGKKVVIFHYDSWEGPIVSH